MSQQQQEHEAESEQQIQDSDAIKQLKDMPEGSQVEYDGGVLIKPSKTKVGDHYFEYSAIENGFQHVCCTKCPQCRILTDKHTLKDGSIILRSEAK